MNPDEFFEVLLFEPIGDGVDWALENSSAMGVIQADETQFSIETPEVHVASQEEGDDLGGDFRGAAYEFRVLRHGYSRFPDGAITVPWTVDASEFDGTGASGPASPGDFVDQNGDPIFDSQGNRAFPSGALEFAPGEMEKLVTIYARADRIAERDESFHLVLGQPQFSNSPNPGRPLSVHPDLSRSRGLIFNEDIVAQPTLSVDAGFAEVYEGADVILATGEQELPIATKITVTRDGDILNNPVTVTVSLTGDTSDQAFLMIGPPTGIDPSRSGPNTIDIPFAANHDTV